MKAPAERMKHLSEHFFAALGTRLAAMHADGIDVIRLDEGAPDLPPAGHIIDALTQAARRDDYHSYQSHRGPAALRAAWAEMYWREHQVELDPDTEILPLLGSKEGIFHLAQAYVQPGDVVLAPDPGYITYTRGTLMAGAEMVPLPLLAERSYLPDFSAIPADVLQRARLLWLNYPNNPTAAVATEAFFAQAVEFARRHNLLLCHDAAYTLVTFDGKPAPSLLRVQGAKEVAVEFNTLSKSHNMAGWRVAALVGNAQVVRAMHLLKTNVDSGHFLPVMEAATAALTGDQSWIWQRNEIYRQRRDVLVEGLRQIGMTVHLPQASLYVWCLVPHSRRSLQPWDSASFAREVLERAHVSLTPGTVFGPLGEGYVRISITAPLERIVEAVARLKEWMKP
jgi:LL-diaminopimelate aminotransferase